MQDDKSCNIMDELLQNVCMAFEELSAQTLNMVFLTLQSCHSQILQVECRNDYIIRHINKDKLERTWTLPNVLEVEEGVVRGVLDYLARP